MLGACVSSSEDFNDSLSWMFEISLSQSDIAEIAKLFKGIYKPVVMYFFVRSLKCPTCKPAMDLAEALRQAIVIAGKTDLMKIREYSLDESEGKALVKFFNVSRVPTILLLNGYIRYVGIPSGEELNSFIETIIRIGTEDVGLSNDVREAIEELGDERINIEVMVTPTCPYCPYAVITANMFAYVSYMSRGKLTSEVIELYENPDIAYKYSVMSVPAIAINGRLAFIGLPSEHELLSIIKRILRS